jgi:hypothetical protein
MSSARDEQRRNSRRLARQVLGGIILILVIIGLATMVGWGVTGVRSLLDDSKKKQEYADRLYGLVLFDPLPFTDINSVDQTLIKQAGIWGTVYQIQNNGGTLDDYERDEATGCVILPQVEVDAYITNLLGPDYQIQEGAFQTSDMNYLYDEEKQGYLVPITGSVGMYTPEVEKLTNKSGKLYVTVGYIPTFSNSQEMTFTKPTQPVKYMDYVFARGENRKWYLSSLQESDMQPAASSTSSAASSSEAITDPQSVVENNLDSALAESTAEAAPQQGDGQAADSTADSAGDSAAADGTDNASDGDTTDANSDSGDSTDQPAA